MSEREIKESQLLSIQLFTLVFSLISILISMIVTYNQKLDVENKEVIFESEKARKISLFNRILIVIIAITFLYVNYKQYILDKDSNNLNDLKNDKLQVGASIFTIIASLITAYVVYSSTTETVADIENPLV